MGGFCQSERLWNSHDEASSAQPYSSGDEGNADYKIGGASRGIGGVRSSDMATDAELTLRAPCANRRRSRRAGQGNNLGRHS
jgi:hypothetical protein